MSPAGVRWPTTKPYRAVTACTPTSPSMHTLTNTAILTRTNRDLHPLGNAGSLQKLRIDHFEKLAPGLKKKKVFKLC